MNTNDNATPNDPAETSRRRDAAARSILPTLLSLLPLAVVTAALEWCARFLLTLARGRGEASAMHDRSVNELDPDVRAVCDVILAAVLEHTAVDALGAPGDGAWDDGYVAAALAAVQRTQETVTGLGYGEREPEGVAVDVSALDVRERAATARRRAVVVAIVATIPQGARDEVLAAVIAWEGVLGGLARACLNTRNPQVAKACDAAAFEAAETFTTSTREHHDAVTALSALWHRGDCFLAARVLTAEDPYERRELVDRCDDAAGDLEHVRALLSARAAA